MHLPELVVSIVGIVTSELGTIVVGAAGAGPPRLRHTPPAVDPSIGEVYKGLCE